MLVKVEKIDVMKDTEYPYVLITAARNESAYIQKTLESVIAQTILPKKWIIVDDGSTDGMDQIVKSYLNRFKFIDLISLEGQKDRNFSSKVFALKAGYDFLKDIEHDYIGVLDADISFENNYYERVFEKFTQNKKLGIAGGIRYDLHGDKFRKVVCARNSVGGPTQLFRRQCYEQIDGFLPLEMGGEDAVAETMARMYGWEVETFPDIVLYHHRPTGTASSNNVMALVRDGIRSYSLGYHPFFQLARCLYRIKEKPYIIAGLSYLVGYTWAFLRGYKRPVSNEFVKYLRSEQMQRLRAIFRRKN